MALIRLIIYYIYIYICVCVCVCICMTQIANNVMMFIIVLHIE